MLETFALSLAAVASGLMAFAMFYVLRGASAQSKQYNKFYVQKVQSED